MTTIREAMDSLPEERIDYYKSLVGTVVTTIEVEPNPSAKEPDEVEIHMVLTRKCEDGTLDYKMKFTARSGKITWPKEGAGDES